MAKDVTGNPWIFDAENQGEGLESTATGRIFDTINPYIRRIRCVTAGTSGSWEVRDTSATGRIIVAGALLDPTSSESVDVLDNTSIFISDLPTSAKIYVHHGDAEEGC